MAYFTNNRDAYNIAMRPTTFHKDKIHVYLSHVTFVAQKKRDDLVRHSKEDIRTLRMNVQDFCRTAPNNMIAEEAWRRFSALVKLEDERLWDNLRLLARVTDGIYYTLLTFKRLFAVGLQSPRDDIAIDFLKAELYIFEYAYMQWVDKTALPPAELEATVEAWEQTNSYITMWCKRWMRQINIDAG
jgi:hypothetical protein